MNPAPANDVPEGPAERLVGMTLLDKWRVIERIRRDVVRSGEPRSSCYRAESKEGESAFIKAFDFRLTDVDTDPKALENMVREFNHERDVHELCRDKRLARVTRIHDASKVVIEGQAVHFLVCEYAPQSLRDAHPPGRESVPPSERFDGLRKVASGIAQLHGADVAHQDIKLSNAVACASGEVKVSDLGSSSCKSLPPVPHDSLSFCGQPNYAPYELLYNYQGSWMERRIGCDMFLLGNLAYTSFAGHSLSWMVLHSLPEELRHHNSDDYELVLPHLIECHNELVPLLVAQSFPGVVAEDAKRLILSMCHPDPRVRGLAINKHRSVQFSLERCISALDLMARKCRAQVKHAA